MTLRRLILATICLAFAAPGRAANLDALLFPLTGEVRLRNTSAAPVGFALYSITSSSGALNGTAAVWKSISDNYDKPSNPTPGNGLIDANFAWTKISAVSTQLTEGAFSGPGGSLPAFRTVSLGNIWNPVLYPFPDLSFTVVQADTTPVAMTILFAVAGDYNTDGTVNAGDYTLWRQNLGSTTNLSTDGNLNGVVDAADYVVWRDNLGAMLPGAGSGTTLGLASMAVPEPAVAILALLGASSMFIAHGRARRAGHRG